MARTRQAPPARVRIKDVAARARVSVGTVSHVLSGHTQVSARLRARVQQAIADLRYVPNFHAQGLRGGTARVVGLCLPHASTAYLNALAEALEEIAARAGYGVMHVFSRHDPATERDRIAELIRYGVAGLVLLPSPAPRPALDLAAAQGVPLVIVDRPTRDARFDQVILDNRDAMRDVAQRLIALGHARLLFVCRSRSRLVTQHRIRGLDAARKRAPRPTTAVVVEFQDDAAFLRAELARILGHARPPTAIVVSNSHQASLVLGILADLLVRCPDDVSVVAFDDPEWSTLVRPRLSVVRQPARAMAQAAWDLLMQRIAGVAGAPRTVALGATTDFRESVARPAAARAGARVLPLARAKARPSG